MTPEEIITSFRQGGTGNCVSIAIIKAAIEIFGLNKIFHATGNEAIGYRITMRDGCMVDITPGELELAAVGSRFIELGSKVIFNYANLCFAAMVKRVQTEKNDDFGPMTFDEAIETLNEGEYYLEGANWLGLRHHTRSVGRKYIYHYPGVIGASRKHCFFVSCGIEDNYGSIDPVGNLERRFCKWLRVSSEQLY